jgi:hypothetical protein
MIKLKKGNYYSVAQLVKGSTLSPSWLYIILARTDFSKFRKTERTSYRNLHCSVYLFCDEFISTLKNFYAMRGGRKKKILFFEVEKNEK